MNILLWLSTGANIIRLLKIVSGTALLAYALYFSKVEYGMLGGILMLQGILNTCCGSSGCSIQSSDKTNDSKEITYEEVK